MATGAGTGADDTVLETGIPPPMRYTSGRPRFAPPRSADILADDQVPGIVSEPVSVEAASNAFKDASFEPKEEPADNRFVPRDIPALPERDMTPQEMLQWLQKLQVEVTLFEKKLLAMNTTPASQISPTTNQIKEELSRLKTLMLELQQETSTQASQSTMPIAKSLSLQQDLIQQIRSEVDNFMHNGQSVQPIVSKTTGIRSGADAPAMLTYELTCSPDASRVILTSRITALESRVAHLEKLIGSLSPEEQISLGAPLIVLTRDLRKKVNLLSTGNLDLIDAKLKVVTAELKNAKESLHNHVPSDSSETKINQAKIDALFEMMKKWDTTAQCLPAIVERMRTLHTVHKAALSLTEDIQQIEVGQARVSELLVSNNKLLSQMETSFKENIEVMQANLQILLQRLSTTKSKS